jgi:hypothetical protein
MISAGLRVLRSAHPTNEAAENKLVSDIWRAMETTRQAAQAGPSPEQREDATAFKAALGGN